MAASLNSYLYLVPFSHYIYTHMYFLSRLKLIDPFEMVHVGPLRYYLRIWKLKEAVTEEVTGSPELSGLILYATQEISLV